MATLWGFESLPRHQIDIQQHPGKFITSRFSPENHEITVRPRPKASIDSRGYLQTKLALKLLTLTFVRAGELRGAEWSEIDFEHSEQRIPAERMKMRAAHIVLLSRNATVSAIDRAANRLV